jgi:uncharacterized membrane protein YqjE
VTAQGPGSDAPNGQAAASDQSIGQLVSEVTDQIGTLVRKQLEMAVVELRDELRRAVKAGGMLSGGAVSGYLALLFASLALAWALDSKMPRPVAFFTVAVLHGLAAGALLRLAQQEVEQVDPVAKQTVESLKDNLEWAKAQTS